MFPGFRGVLWEDEGRPRLSGSFSSCNSGRDGERTRERFPKEFRINPRYHTMVTRTNRWHTRFLYLLLIAVFFMGCTSPDSSGNLPDPDIPTLSAEPMPVPRETPVDPEIIMNNDKMADTYGPSTLAQNATVYHRFDSNTSYELTLGDITIRQNETPKTGPSCIITMNVTVRNSGTDPIGVIFQTEDLMDYAGDGCQSRALSWCGTLFLGTIHPETSKTGTEDITIFSPKGCDYLSAEKFLLQAVIVADSDKVGGV